MNRTNQTIYIEYDENNRATIRNQTVTNVVVDSDNYAAGLWKNRVVASYHVDNGEWAVVDHK